VYPSIDEAALKRAFSQIKSQKVQIQDAQVAAAGPTATVSCTWNTVYEGQVGGSRRAAPKIQLRLQKTSNGWIIVDRR
jgi:ketosteroid isomerase-like protein